MKLEEKVKMSKIGKSLNLVVVVRSYNNNVQCLFSMSGNESW
jgi:hypothetical protein